MTIDQTIKAGLCEIRFTKNGKTQVLRYCFARKAAAIFEEIALTRIGRQALVTPMQSSKFSHCKFASSVTISSSEGGADICIKNGESTITHYGVEVDLVSSSPLDLGDLQERLENAKRLAGAVEKVSRRPLWWLF